MRILSVISRQGKQSEGKAREKAEKQTRNRKYEIQNAKFVEEPIKDEVICTTD